MDFRGSRFFFGGLEFRSRFFSQHGSCLYKTRICLNIELRLLSTLYSNSFTLSLLNSLKPFVYSEPYLVLIRTLYVLSILKYIVSELSIAYRVSKVTSLPAFISASKLSCVRYYIRKPSYKERLLPHSSVGSR